MLIVGCTEDKEDSEVSPSDYCWQKVVIAFPCPKCDDEAVRVEPDVFLCTGCKRVWCVH